MNNGKVRIYELSRELNLENKDILAVCERLNISVKSHSSTITESEAERIRKTAEKLPAHPPSKPTSQEKGPSHREGAPHPDRKKQEILEVRSPKTLSDPHRAKVGREDSRPPLLANPPKQLTAAGEPIPPQPVLNSPPLAETAVNISESLVIDSLDGENSDSISETPANHQPENSLHQTTQPVSPFSSSVPTSDSASVAQAHPNLTSSPVPESQTGEAPSSYTQEKPLNKDKAMTQSQLSQGAATAGPDRRTAAAADNFSAEESEESPKLVSPPVRPAATFPSNLSLSMTANRPVLKQQRSKKKNQSEDAVAVSSAPPKEKSLQNPQKSEGGGTQTLETKKRKEKTREAGPSSVPQPISRKTADSESGGGKPRPELHRPDSLGRKSPNVVKLTPPNPPSAGDDEDVLAEPREPRDNDLRAPIKRTAILDKPTHPRLATKRTSTWEVDEDDESESHKAKVAKAKRPRAKPLIDEDDDEELVAAGLDVSAPVVASLSLVRPAKPKALTPKSTVKPTAAHATKGKKPGESRNSAAFNRGNRRQSAADVVVEKPTKLVLGGSMTVQELAIALMVPETDIIKRLFSKGIAVNITETLDLNSINMVADELGIEIETAEKAAEARKVTEMLDAADLENLQRRPPVVTIMGHVDHGKTTLLDSIRETKVAQGEAGGITQHIGAYHVDVEHEGETQQVVFLDTPGHEAFTAMRARGARVTDIAVLVVAADDGVRPQTIEAISHAKAAQVPIVVAINKIDKEAANPDRVKQELAEYGLVPEEWGGDTIMVPVSALRGENLDTLLEMMLLVAEIEDLQANPNRAAKGTVIEAHLDKARGPVATLLVQNGTLQVGNVIVAGSALGKVRAMIDDRGERVEAAGPSFAVEILGLRDVPRAGDEFDVFENEKEAAAIASARADAQRQSRLQQGRISLSGFSQQAKDGQLKELNLILKADVQGSVEAIVEALRQLPQREVQLRLLLAAPGEITETDIDLAAASGGVLIGFNTTLGSVARQASDQYGVDVREYNIIYKLLDDVQAAMEGLLEPELVEEPLGEVEIRAVFPVGKGSVAGCYVLSGKVIRNCKLRVRRQNNIVYEGVLDSLKRMKDDVKEVNAGYECGIRLDNFNAWQEGDIIEAYRMTTKRRTLSN